MTSKNVALLSGVSCIVVLATYAWAASQDASEVKVEEAAVQVEAATETARLCIPMAEAEEATAAVVETDEAAAEDKAEETKTEASDDTAETKTVETEAVSAEVSLPICDEAGNPPAAEGDAAASEATTEKATEEPAKAE